jgi:uncharacterized surface protein with fasciclin (FAS1) repeats
MKSVIKLMSALMAFAILLSTNSFAQEKRFIVSGASMSPSKTIIEYSVKSKQLTTFVAAVKAAGLADTLSGAGPFTVFAPTNQAFNKLPKGTVTMLLKPESKDALTKVLTNHVVGGKINSTELMNMIKNNGGSYKVKTLQGGGLTFMLKEKNIFITDEKGSISKITIADVNQSNGVVHIINTVLMPKS